MKSLALLLLCVCLFSASLAIRPVSNEKRIVESNVSNPIDDLWVKALEFIRALLKKYQPFEVPDMPVQTVTGDDISLTAKFNHVKVSDAENFTIDKIENSVLGLWAKFQVTVPKMLLQGEYTASGTVKDKNVNGKGDFQIHLGALVVTGYIKVDFKGTYLQMSKFDMDYSLDSLTFSETGLVIDGMTTEEIEDLFQSTSLKYFTENEKFVCSQIGAYVMEQANKIMYQKSLQGLLDWLKDFIDGKVVTTPDTITLN